MLALARQGLRVTVNGPYWKRLRTAYANLSIRRDWLEGLDYTKAVNATKNPIDRARTGARR